MNTIILANQWNIPEHSTLDRQDYLKFLEASYDLMHQYPQYFSSSDGMEVLDLAHLELQGRQEIQLPLSNARIA